MHWHLAATDSHTIHYEIITNYQTSMSGQQQQHRGQLTGPHSMGGFDPGMLYSIGSSSAFAPLPLIRYGSKPVGAFCKPPWRSISMGCTVGGWADGVADAPARSWRSASVVFPLSASSAARVATSPIVGASRQAAAVCEQQAAAAAVAVASAASGGPPHTHETLALSFLRALCV